MLSAASLESKSISRTGRSRPLGPAVLFAIYGKFKNLNCGGSRYANKYEFGGKKVYSVQMASAQNFCLRADCDKPA